jgi:DNA-directed RNA polymerase subunit RPC12/RpoP
MKPEFFKHLAVLQYVVTEEKCFYCGQNVKILERNGEVEYTCHHCNASFGGSSGLIKKLIQNKGSS